MLAQIPDRIRSKVVVAALAICAAGALSSCATHEKPPLISDGTNGRESTIPWNKQEKWESQGQFANMTDRRQ
jgi:hypothetical protein